MAVDQPPQTHSPSCTRIILYCKKTEEMIAFYGALFGYRPITRDGDRIVELSPADGGVILMLHPASKGQKEGQSRIKLVFDVRDVVAFRENLHQQGLDCGPVHQADGYHFANFRDPSGNPVSISSRAFAT